jgi:hypothetical protein
MRQLGDLEAVIMDRLWEWGRPALVRERWLMPCTMMAARLHHCDDGGGEPAPEGVVAAGGRPGVAV